MYKKAIKLAEPYLMHQSSSSDGEPISGEVYEFEPEELKQFIHQIVAECVDSMEKMPRYFRQTDGRRVEECTIKDCIKTVKEHFDDV